MRLASALAVSHRCEQEIWCDSAPPLGMPTAAPLSSSPIHLGQDNRRPQICFRALRHSK